MDIKGIQKTSLVDYPGRLSTVIFFGGCNFKCGYCHNPDLVRDYHKIETYSPIDVVKIIKKRSSLIDAVVITGGEATLYNDLNKFINEIKEMNLPVKLDTNGSNPGVIRHLIEGNLVDYFAIDIKTSPEKYRLATGVNVDFDKITESIEIVKQSGIDYEIRTTCVPRYVGYKDFTHIKNKIGRVKKYFLQQFVNKITLDPLFLSEKPYNSIELNKFKEFVSTFADVCEIRGLDTN